MSSVLTEENQYSRFAFRNFQKIHVIVIYSQKEPNLIEYADLVQKLENAFQPDPIFSFAYIDVDQVLGFQKNQQTTNNQNINQQISQLPQVIIKSNPEVIQQTRLFVSPTSLFQEIQRFKEPFINAFESEKQLYMEKCQKLVEGSPFLIFIKGTPQQPKCKFTRALLSELKTLNVQFHFYDIDNDQGMRQWLKFYSGWKTFPQIFASGKLIGGLDVVKELINKGEFLSKLPQSVILHDLSSLVELQKLAPRLILHYDQPDSENEIAKFLHLNNLEYQFYNVQLNEVLSKQLEAKALGHQVLLLQNGQLYNLEQLKELKN